MSEEEIVFCVGCAVSFVLGFVYGQTWTEDKYEKQIDADFKERMRLNSLNNNIKDVTP